MVIRGGLGLLPILLVAFLMCLAVTTAPTEQDPMDPASNQLTHAHSRKRQNTDPPLPVPQSKLPRLADAYQPELIPPKSLSTVWEAFRVNGVAMQYPRDTLDSLAEHLFLPFRATNHPKVIDRGNIISPRFVIYLKWALGMWDDMWAGLGSPSEPDPTIQVGTGDNMSRVPLEQAVAQLHEYAHKILEVHAAWSNVLPLDELHALNRNIMFKGIMLVYLRLRQKYNEAVKRTPEEAEDTLLNSLRTELEDVHRVPHDNSDRSDSWPSLLMRMHRHAETMISGLAQPAPPNFVEDTKKTLKQLQIERKTRNLRFRETGQQFLTLLKSLESYPHAPGTNRDTQKAVRNLATRVFTWKVDYEDHDGTHDSKTINSILAPSSCFQLRSSMVEDRRRQDRAPRQSGRGDQRLQQLRSGI
ncbi:hypothetical protein CAUPRSCDRAFT_11475 [Caulochytrium protostelioides]|uniref:Uncharacterized protein n=1 Tax=Caulochytrium protostelioides TaxID=1555241 RepID=A0A4V1ITF0_9FUNG|nr:hypothetical protein CAUPRSCDRAFT_11475 [Caulochytrium protostelioides]